MMSAGFLRVVGRVAGIAGIAVIALASMLRAFMNFIDDIWSEKTLGALNFIRVCPTVSKY